MSITSSLSTLLIGAAFFLTLVAAPAQTTLISTNTPWRYLDNGSDQGTAWRGAAFDDSGWASGVPLFGAESPGIHPWPIRTPMPMPVGGGRRGTGDFFARTRMSALLSHWRCRHSCRMRCGSGVPRSSTGSVPFLL